MTSQSQNVAALLKRAAEKIDPTSKKDEKE